jgi:hypothetical protein
VENSAPLPLAFWPLSTRQNFPPRFEFVPYIKRLVSVESLRGVPVVVSSNLTAPTRIFKELRAFAAARLTNFLAVRIVSLLIVSPVVVWFFPRGVSF